MPFDKLNPSINADAVRKDLQKIQLASNPIVDAAKAYVEADVQVKPGSNNYTLLEQQGNFARVSVKANDGGGYAVILKKVYELWVVVAAGQDKPGKDVGQKYGLPAAWYSTEY